MDFGNETRAVSSLVSPQALVAYLRTRCADTRSPDRLLACLMIKLRRTDRLSALLGDPHSERFMREIVDTIGRLLRPNDRFAVVSHDEIWVVLPDLAHVEVASVAANRLLTALQAPFGAPDRTNRIKPCIGAAAFPLHAKTIARLLEYAEQARRMAETNDDGYALFQASISTEMHDLDLERELRDAIRDNRIEVHYQPQIEIATGACVSAEALLRMKRRDGTPVSSAVLVAIAERTDIIHPLTKSILATALRHLTDFDRAGWPGSMSVNLSARLLASDDLPDLVAQMLGTWNVPPSRLTLEITETGFVSDMQRSAELLLRLSKMGVHLAMDDFGTGYSSLVQFRQLPLNEVKLDKLFVQNMLINAGDRQIIKSMIDIATNFGMQTVAEGVEDQATFDCLREMGCDLAQGYLYSRALASADFIAWVRALMPKDHEAGIEA
ncbi:MAG: putative bifunctional diguanylate cyclase/phosphodiesterase [Burkholderiales bacterium]